MDHAQGLREVFLRLTGEPNDHVGRDGDIRDRGTDARQRFQVARTAVASAHPLEHAVAPRLQREVDVLADDTAARHRIDHVGREVVWVRTGEADPAQPVYAVERAQQVGEHRPPVEVTAVRVDVLTEERDLNDAVVDEAARLIEHIAQPAGYLRAANVRHDAERARVVAADADRHPCVERVVSAGREGRGERVGLLGELERRGARRFALGQQPGQLANRERSECDVDPRRLLEHERLVLLHLASTDGDAELRPLVLQRLHVAERPVQAVVCVLADRARVEQDDVRALGVGRAHVPVHLEQPRDAFGVVLVHLTAVRADEVGLAHATMLSGDAGTMTAHATRAFRDG